MIKNKLILGVLGLVMIFSCSKESNDYKSPEASFIYTSTPMHAPVLIACTSTSTDANRFEWEVNGVLHDTGPITTFQFNNAGTYKVTLTAYGTGLPSSFSKKFIVGNPYTICRLKKIEILQINLGIFPWDSTDGPDMYVTISSSSLNPPEYNGVNDRIDNVTYADLPLVYNLQPPVDFTDIPWSKQIRVYDYDGPSTSSLMESFYFGIDNVFLFYSETGIFEKDGYRIRFTADWY